MVNHAVEAEELQAYLDRELTEARQAEVERHLADCRACSALLEELQRVSAVLQQWQVEPAPVSLRPPTVEPEKESSWWRWPRLRVLVLAGTAAVALIVGFLSLDVARRTQNEPLDQPKGAPPLVLSAPVVAGKPAAQAGAQSEEQTAAPKPPAALREEPSLGLLRSRRQVPDAQEGRAVGGELEKKSEQVEGFAAQTHPDRIASAEAVDQSEPAQREAPKESDEGALRSSSTPQANRAPAAAAPAATSAVGAMRMSALAPARLIAYEASLSLEVKDIDSAKAKLKKAVEESGGYVAEASSIEQPGQARFADYSLRVPAENLSAVMDALRVLGRVKQENLTSEEVTAQVVDLEARLRNARAAEERLIAVLKEKTGKVRDILEVEREIAGTREDIERTLARQEYLQKRVAFSTLNVTLVEEFKAQLQPAPPGTVTQLWNASVDGYENFTGTLLGLVFFFMRHGLNLLFWGGLLWLSARLAWRTFQRRYRWA